MPNVDEARFQTLGVNINWVEVCKDSTDDQAHWNTTRKGELTWFPSSLLTLSTKIWFYFVITRICPNRNASKMTKEKALYVYEISQDFPFDIGRVITEDITERTKRPSNTALGFPSLIIELCMLNNVQITGNEEKTPHPYALSVKGIKTRPRKSMRGKASGSMVGYDSGRDEEDEEDADATTANEEEEIDEMPPLGHQGKLMLERIVKMFNDHNQTLNDKLDKKNEWHKMYETLATTTSSLANRQDMLWESVANLEGLMR